MDLARAWLEWLGVGGVAQAWLEQVGVEDAARAWLEQVGVGDAARAWLEWVKDGWFEMVCFRCNLQGFFCCFLPVDLEIPTLADD